MSRKRSAEFVDLTGDENQHSKRVYSSQPFASQPRSTQSLNPRDSWGGVEPDEDEEIIDLSQDNEEAFGWLCIGAIDAKIVGLRYYSGFATVGEVVMIRREPLNPYDSNAIRVNNVQGTQIGHIPKVLASKLAYYMDSRSVVIEGVLAGESNGYECPLSLKLFGPGEIVARNRLEALLRRDKIPLKIVGFAAPKTPKTPKPVTPSLTPPRSQMGLQSSQSSPHLSSSQMGLQSSQGLQSSPHLSSSQSRIPELNIAHFVQNSERFNPRDAERLVEAWGAGEDALSKMPKASQPEKLQSTLLPYQLQGLHWMLEKENPVLPGIGSTDIVQLWKRSPGRNNAFQNIATQFQTMTPPVLARGGILADDMGLGKTLQVISVILEGGPGPTLILAPVSVMSNWAQQIERHVKKEFALKVLTYHGSSRKRMTSKDLEEFDVVVTSYGTLSTEYLPRGTKSPAAIPRKEGLFSMNWTRVVLDEGHIIRNHATKSAVAATAVLSKARWVLSGTPIVNTIKDLYSMLKFLGITGGLERLELFNAVLTRPLNVGNRNAEVILQSIMRTLCLRRKKDMKFVDLKLPEKSEYVHRITFRKDEREKYEALEAEAKGMVKKFQASKSKDGFDMYRHVLEILLRMRQVCCHWKLCGARVTDLIALLENDEVVSLTKENVIALQALLQLNVDQQEECSICLDTLHNPVITACKHVFGQECIERTIELQHKCPMCRAELVSKDVLVHPVEEAGPNDELIDTNTKSSKTEALMSILRASRRDPLSKVVIFSQWTSFLNIIEAQLSEADMKYVRIDGSMNAQRRDASMAALESDPDTRILLASLAVCSVGLNLVAADTVILADSWWAPAIEDQAVDRVHRLGQTRPCTVWRLIMEDSIEERVLIIQAEKRKLIGKAFQEKEKGGKEKTTRMGDILKLLS